MLSVNGTTFGEDDVAREAALFAGAADPQTAARRALVVRELLLQRAAEIGLLDPAVHGGRRATRDDEDALVAAVIDAEVRAPRATESECRRYFDAHRDRFASGELVEARHILFAVTAGTPVAALRAQAEHTLAEIQAGRADFAERARTLSNCPSGAHGGNLGQFGRGQMVPEFDSAIFGRPDVGVLPRLVRTRFGFHVVEVARRVAGRTLPFEDVHSRIADDLCARAELRALAQYIQVLAGRASIEGVELAAAGSPLVQ